jgi:hypothetical protein
MCTTKADPCSWTSVGSATQDSTEIREDVDVMVLARTSQKSHKRLIVGTIRGETKREGPRKAKGCIARMNQKKERKLVLVVEKLFHPQPF